MKPIFFNTEMVQAIQEGRKTVTRRLVKRCGHTVERTPYGVGDLLWVRESWAFWPCNTCGEPCVNSGNDSNPMFGKASATMETADGLTEGCFLYRADGEEPVFSGGHIWRPSIHMPRQAARIFLKVKSVYPAKLQESFLYRPSPVREFAGEGLKFSETCLHCQGVHYTTPCEENNELNCIDLLSIKSKFERLWDSTVPKGRRNREGWAADPWVWVIRFERCERPDGWPE